MTSRTLSPRQKIDIIVGTTRDESSRLLDSASPVSGERYIKNVVISIKYAYLRVR